MLDINLFAYCLQQKGHTLGSVSQELGSCLTGRFGLSVSHEVAFKMRLQSSEGSRRARESASKITHILDLSVGCAAILRSSLCGLSRMDSSHAMWFPPG